MKIKYQSKLFVRFLQDFSKNCNLIPSIKLKYTILIKMRLIILKKF